MQIAVRVNWRDRTIVVQLPKDEKETIMPKNHESISIFSIAVQAKEVHRIYRLDSGKVVHPRSDSKEEYTREEWLRWGQPGGACVCQGADPTGHAHYPDPPHKCARCSECDEYRPNAE